MKPLSKAVISVSKETLIQSSEQPSALTVRAPRDNQQSALTLLRQNGFTPKFERAVSGKPLSVALNPSEAANWQNVGEMLSQLMAPASDADILQWLTIMMPLCAKKDADEEITTVQLVGISKKLSKWPGDVVREVLDMWPEKQTYWPNAFKNLADELNKVAADRLVLLKTYRRWLDDPEFMARREGLTEFAPDSQPNRTPVSDPTPKPVSDAAEKPEMTREEFENLKAEKIKALKDTPPSTAVSQ